MQLNSESYREKMKIWEASSLVLSFRKRERDVIEEGQEAKRWVLQLNSSPRKSHQSCPNVTGELIMEKWKNPGNRLMVYSYWLKPMVIG